MKTENFVCRLVEEYNFIHIKKIEGDIWEYGRSAGWLEALDEIGRDKEIERRTVARIVHQFLKTECGERDEAEWSEAKKLKDIYDCRTCVNHVAQVYAKGIMEAVTTAAQERVFDMRGTVSEEEARRIIHRAFDRNERVKVRGDAAGSLGEGKAVKISFQQAMNMVQSVEKVLLVDVRTEADYEKEHLSGAVNIPMAWIISGKGSGRKNNGIDLMDKSITKILYCNIGCQSEIAAGYLAEKGFEKVFYFGKDEIDI